MKTSNFAGAVSRLSAVSCALVGDVADVVRIETL